MGTRYSEFIAAVYVMMYFYAINNCGNTFVLFGVDLICGYWSSCIGGFPFLAILLICRLFSSWIFQYALLSIAAESRPLLFPVPPGEIAYVNFIFSLIYIYFASYYAASWTTPTVAFSAFKSAASSSSSSFPSWIDPPYLSMRSWW